MRLITAYLSYARELWQNNALVLQFLCLSNALTLRVCALDASKSQRACIILSQFTHESKYAIIKEIFSDSNIILLWHESEDINKKKHISKISVDSNFAFLSCTWLCVFHCSHRLLCCISLMYETFCENCSHFKPRVNHLTHLSHSVSLHGQKDSFFTHFWVILSVYWPTMAQMSQMIHSGFSVIYWNDFSLIPLRKCAS